MMTATEPTLSECDRNALAGRLLEAGQRYVSGRMGDNYAEYVGDCLTEMLNEYAGDVAGFDDYFFMRVARMCAQKARKFMGSPGTVRWASTRQAETLDNEEAIAVQDDTQERIDYRGQLVESLRQINAFDWKDARRWKALAAILGCYNGGDMRLICSPETQIISPQHFIDAIMLFGASMKGIEGKRIVLQRTSAMFPSLAWAVIQMERHDIAMRYQCGESTALTRAKYTSRTTRALEDAYRRWYASSVLAVPADISLTTATLIYWLVPAACNKTPNRNRYRLTAPRMPVDTAGKYARQIRKLTGWRCEAQPTANYARIIITADVRTWLAQYVPARMWEGDQ